MSRALFSVAAVFACVAPAFAAAAYFSELSDVPLPPGFTERDTAVGFDGEGGRLVVAQAMGDLPPLGVRDFYTDALPQLGWALSPGNEDALVFVRGRERVSFTMGEWEGRTRLHVSLVVRPASMNAD